MKRRSPKRPLAGTGCRAYRGRGTWGGRILAAMGLAALILAALCAFVLPGVRFSALLFAALAAVCALLLLLGRWAAVSRAGTVCRRVFCVLLAAGLVAFAAGEAYLFRAGAGDSSAQRADAVIVLGAGVNGTAPSLVLQSRIDAAQRYLAAHPDIPAVLSGGHGSGEEISEAQAMYRALTAAGIAPGRLYLEEKSTTTAENFRNSAALLRTLEIDPDTARVAVVTSDFHLFRAQLLGRQSGLHTLGVPAHTAWWWLNANYYAREFFALGKTLLT